MYRSSEIYKSVLEQLKLADGELSPSEYIHLLDDVIEALEVKREKLRQAAKEAVHVSA